ncbi:MAG: GIY-YIG nuclease family protein [Bacteroidota bacterium]
MRPGYVYILTNKNNTTLYVGVTSNLEQRIKQNRSGLNPRSFTNRYKLYKLVYFETYQMIGDAVAREKQIKAGSRQKKIDLIEKNNPMWDDLY